MKKLLTLITAIIMVVSLAAPAVATNYYQGIGLEFTQGSTVSLFDFEGDDAASFTISSGDSLSDADGVLTVAKDAGTAEKTLDLRSADMFESYISSAYLFSFKFRTDFSTLVNLSTGNTNTGTNRLMRVGLRSNGYIEYYTYEKTGEPSIIETTEYQNTSADADGWTKVDILFDNVKREYHLWVNATGNVFDAAPVIGGCDYYRTGNQKAFRIWTTGISAESSGHLYVKDMKITSFVDNLFPEVTSSGYAYEEPFTDYPVGAYDETAEPWLSMKDTILKTRNDSPSTQSNPADFEITNNKALKITYGAGQYHHWYFANVADYPIKKSDENKLIIQADIKSNKKTTVYIASRGLSGARALIEDNGSRYVKTFVHADDVASAPYTTVTFLIEATCYSVWMDGVKVKDRVTSPATNKPDTICFLCTDGEAGHEIYVDNIRVYKTSDDYINVYNFLNSVTDMDDLVTTDSEGVTGFGVDEGLDASNVTVSFRDSKGYYSDGSITFPLVSDSDVDVRAVVSSGDYSKAVSYTNVTFPSGYTSVTRTADPGTGTASFAATLRNNASARTSELLAMAAAYNSDGDIINVKECTFDGSSFAADFGEGVAYNRAAIFVWEAATLRPVK